MDAMNSLSFPPRWIDTPEGLRALAADLASQPRIAVDTESNSLYAYREQVCLIQFSTSEQDYLLDPLALRDLTPLAGIFSSPSIEKVFHAAEYDLICLKRDFGFSFAGIFDTMQAARILGYRAVGLDKLLAEKFGVKVDKRFQKADWGKRPLPPEMLHYARLDTHYLLPLRDILEGELRAKGRWALAKDDFSLVARVDGPTPSLRAPRWERVGKQRRMNARELTLLNELYRAREAIAKKMNRPLFKVVSDSLLANLAESAPHTPRGLEEAGFSRRQVRAFGDAFLEAVQRGERAPLVRRTQNQRPSSAYIRRMDALKQWRKRVAREMDVESDVILPKRFLRPLSEDAPHTMEDLANILGDSPERLRRFGREILKVLEEA